MKTLFNTMTCHELSELSVFGWPDAERNLHGQGTQASTSDSTEADRCGGFICPGAGIAPSTITGPVCHLM